MTIEALDRYVKNFRAHLEGFERHGTGLFPKELQAAYDGFTQLEEESKAAGQIVHSAVVRMMNRLKIFLLLEADASGTADDPVVHQTIELCDSISAIAQVAMKHEAQIAEARLASEGEGEEPLRERW